MFHKPFRAMKPPNFNFFPQPFALFPCDSSFSFLHFPPISPFSLAPFLPSNMRIRCDILFRVHLFWLCSGSSALAPSGTVHSPNISCTYSRSLHVGPFSSPRHDPPKCFLHQLSIFCLESSPSHLGHSYVPDNYICLLRLPHLVQRHYFCSSTPLRGMFLWLHFLSPHFFFCLGLDILTVVSFPPASENWLCMETPHTPLHPFCSLSRL